MRLKSETVKKIKLNFVRFFRRIAFLLILKFEYSLVVLVQYINFKYGFNQNYIRNQLLTVEAKKLLWDWLYGWNFNICIREFLFSCSFHRFDSRWNRSFFFVSSLSVILFVLIFTCRHPHVFDRVPFTAAAAQFPVALSLSLNICLSRFFFGALFTLVNIIFHSWLNDVLFISPYRIYFPLR